MAGFADIFSWYKTDKEFTLYIHTFNNLIKVIDKDF